MTWLPFVLLIVIHAAHSMAMKPMTDRLPRIKALLAMYLVCSLCGLLFWITFDGTLFTSRDLLVVGVGLGFLNFIVVQLYWAAYKINMSRTSLFLPLVSLFSATLLAIFLQEYEHLNLLAVTGFAIHLIAVWLFKVGQAQKNGGEEEEKYGRWLILTIALIATQSLQLFLMKVVASDVPTTQYIPMIYLGCLMYFGITLLCHKKEAMPPKYKSAFWGLIPVIGVLTAGFTACVYWMFQKNDGIASVSFFALSQTFVPALVGWIFFKEGKGFSRIELAGFFCGVTAALLIIFSH